MRSEVGPEIKIMNSELKNDEQGNSRADTSFYNKQPSVAAKKMVLADVQNDKRVARNYRESSFLKNGGPTADKVKVSGTKRLTTLSPTSHLWPPRPDHTAAKEHLVYTTKKTENTNRNMNSPPLKRFCSMQQETPEKQSQVVENNTHQVHLATSNYMVPKNMLSYSNPSLELSPTSFASPGNGAGPAETVCLDDTSKVAPPSDSKRVKDQKIGQNWEERYINLQNYLKICDNESTHKNHIQSELLYYCNITNLLTFVPSISSFNLLIISQFYYL